MANRGGEHHNGFERFGEVPLRTRIAQTLARARSDISFAAMDAMLIVIAYSAALVLRFVELEDSPGAWLESFAVVLPIIVGLHLVANLAFGAYGHVWEYASIEEALRLVYATAVAALTVIGGIYLLRAITDGPVVGIPLLVAVVGALLALGGMGALRFRSRLFSFKRITGISDPLRTLVIGTDRRAVDLARHGAASSIPRSVIGFVSVNGGGQLRHLAGREVLGSLDEIGEVVEAFDVDEVIVVSRLSEDQLRHLVDSCMSVEVRLRILPDLDENPGNSSYLRDIRDLELEDLLPRRSVAADLTGAFGLLSGKIVLVTGAGGSIGSEICRQLLELGARVAALDHDETHLHDALLSWPNLANVESILCDIREIDDVDDVMTRVDPDIVFHAAALKHVPILESHPAQAVKTNVFGTANVLDATRSNGVSHFVLISTDKAVNPEGVLGASKRIAEMLVQAAAAADPNTRYASVRFGNVLGSRGSVVPTFMKQIRDGGPVTITDPRMTRYFMTVSEAIGLVLQAAALAERGEVFVLDMGEPARIEDLAHRMIRLAGLVPGRDIEVVVTGPRPGEKTNEILSAHPLVPSPHPRIQVTYPGFPGSATMLDILGALSDEIRSRNDQGLRSILRDLGWQEWQPNELVDLTALEEFVV